MASDREIDEAFQALCTELVSLACIVEAARPAGAPLDFHRNAAVISAVSKCLTQGERLSSILTPGARPGAWRRTVGSFMAQRQVSVTNPPALDQASDGGAQEQ